MAYKVPKTEHEVLALKEQREPEGPFLEYKSARLFKSKNDKIFETLSKELTAFANAAGGVLIIGIKEDSERCIEAFEPITDDKKMDSWLEDGLLPRISPPMAMTVQEIEVEHGKLLVIDVPPSPSAPHQASDRKYYARRLYRVDPLLAFEIDDIRRRAEGSPLNVSVGIWFENGIINFFIKNSSINPIYNIKVKIGGINGEEISKAWNPGIERPYLEPFRIIHQDEKMSFLGANFQFFKQKSMDEIIVSVLFSDSHGVSHQKEKKFYLKDYESAQFQRTNAERSLEKIEEHLSGINKALQEFALTAKSASESAIHSSGVNLSKTSLAALSSSLKWKWSGENLSHMALAEVLEVDMDTAHKIWSDLFGQYHLIGGRSVDLKHLDVDEEVKEKIRKRLVIKDGV